MRRRRREGAAQLPSDGALVRATGVGVRLGGRDVLSGADLALAPGRLTALVGPNGAGKSTLARAIAGMQRCSAGEVRWGGEDVGALRGRALARRRAFVPQRGAVPAGVTVRDAVTVGRSPHLKPLGRLTKDDHAAVRRAMARTGVADFAARQLNTLSGGELQRVQIAVGLAQETPVLLADEPTSALDLGATAGLARVLRRLVDEDGLAVLLVVHDLALAAAVADEVVVMAGGRTVATGAAADVLTPERLAEVWEVDGELAAAGDGRTGLHVRWLDEPPRPSPTKARR